MYLLSDLRRMGLCNRIIKWAYLYKIAEINNMKIAVDWPEFKYLNVPNTDYIPFSFLKTQSFKLSDLKLNEYKLDTTKNWIENSHWNFDRSLDCELLFRLISLKNITILNKIKNFCTPLIGVHVRRGDFYKTNVLKIECNTRLVNEYYFSLMDQCLERDNTLLFYLASDGNSSELLPFYERYKNKIFTYKNIYHEYDINMIKLIDLFALSHTRYVIASVSTFSHFAINYLPTNGKWPELPPILTNFI